VPDLDLALPPGTRLISLAERPELRGAIGEHNASVWPEFMLHSPVANRLWNHLAEWWPEFQLALLGDDGAVLAAHNSAPLAWDGTDGGLPAGWEDQFERSVADHRARTPPTTLGALQIVVRPERQGTGLAGTMLQAMRANARAHGLAAVIACVRPTGKPAYPLIPIERYAAWTREDGLPFDPWIRLHVRIGGRIVHPSPRSMTIIGSVAEWESWAGMAFPESGDYVVPGTCEPVRIDREADRGTLHDPNLWVVHDLPRGD
jgi:GNAT superfamily N-acetyltransferase